MGRLWPYGLVLPIVFLAALAIGADRPAAALSFSALLLFMTGGLLMLRSASVSGPGVAWVIGAVILFGVGVLNGWQSTGAGEYASLLAGAGVFLAARSAGLRKDRTDILWAAVVALGGLLAFIVFADFIVDPRRIFWIERPYHFSRLSAPFLSANTAATFFGVIGLMALALVLKGVRRSDRPGEVIKAAGLPLAALLVAGTCVFLTGSRAGVTAFAAAAIALFLWDGLSRFRSGGERSGSFFSGATLVVLIGLAIFGVSGGVYAERFFGAGTDIGSDPRGVMFARYLSGIWYAPWFGAGLGGFEFINDFLATAVDARTITGQNAAHNVAFQWIFQAGIVGAVAALGVVVWLLRLILEGFSRRRSQRLYLRAGLVIAAFVFAHGMVDYGLEIPAVMWLFSLVLGLSAGVAAGGSRSSLPRRLAGRAAKWSVVAVFLLGGALSAFAAADRSAAVTVQSLSDDTFLARYQGGSELTGSPVLLEAVGDRALRLDVPDYGLAGRAFRASLEGEARSGKVWMKLAFSNYQIIPIIAGETEEAIREAYYIMPYADRDFVDWRLSFMAQAWPQLPEDLRQSAVRETRMLSPRQRDRWLATVGVEGERP